MLHLVCRCNVTPGVQVLSHAGEKQVSEKQEAAKSEEELYKRQLELQRTNKAQEAKKKQKASNACDVLSEILAL